MRTRNGFARPDDARVESARLEPLRQRVGIGARLVRRDLQRVARLCARGVGAMNRDCRVGRCPVATRLSPTGARRRWRERAFDHAARRVVLAAGCAVSTAESGTSDSACRSAEQARGRSFWSNEQTHEHQPGRVRVRASPDSRAGSVRDASAAAPGRRAPTRAARAGTARRRRAPRADIRRRCGGSRAPRRRSSPQAPRASTTRRRSCGVFGIASPRDRSRPAGGPPRRCRSPRAVARARRPNLRCRARRRLTARRPVRDRVSATTNARRRQNALHGHGLTQRAGEVRHRRCASTHVASSCSSDERRVSLIADVRLEQRLERVVHRIAPSTDPTRARSSTRTRPTSGP